MEYYGPNYGSGAPAIESESLGQQEWERSSEEQRIDSTGLEQAIFQIGIRDTSSSSPGPNHPYRPGEQDCTHYMRTGHCAFGRSCKFNHPPHMLQNTRYEHRRASTGGLSLRSSSEFSGRSLGGEYPERPGQPDCNFYMRTGLCKFGLACRFNHPREFVSSMASPAFNSDGYPLRSGEKECDHYMRTGVCKYGVTCKFHHPERNLNPYHSPHLAVLSNPLAQPPMPPGIPWQVPRTAYLPQLRPPQILLPHQIPPWAYQPQYASPDSHSPAFLTSAGTLMHFHSMSPRPLTSPGPGPKDGGLGGGTHYPERPGEPDCQFYLKTGLCKFGASCKFHHPQHRLSAPSASLIHAPVAVNPSGLPLRPGCQPCEFYLRNGICKYGAVCKFDHPVVGSDLPIVSSLSPAHRMAAMAVQVTAGSKEVVARGYTGEEGAAAEGGEQQKQQQEEEEAAEGPDGGSKGTQVGQPSELQ